MIKFTWAIAAMLLANISVAQNNLPKHAIQAAGGYSNHGSGDMKGISFGADYIRYTSKKFSLNIGFSGSINHSKEEIIVTDNFSGTRHDASVRFTTAGVQLNFIPQYSFVRNSRHQLLAGLGVLGRYQSASNGSDGFSLYMPTTTGVPTVLVGYNNRTPQNTFAAGAIALVQYDYTLKKNFFIGFSPAFQLDTQGDAMPQLLLLFGKRL